MSLIETEKKKSNLNLILSLDGFEGPIDLLLVLARDQKVDLLNISILQLAEQYLFFVEDLKDRFIELAADYLVMASWLAFIKSKLLLPDEEHEEPSAEEMAASLRWQLLRLEAMQRSGKEIINLPQRSKDFFGRDDEDGLQRTYKILYDGNRFDLLNSYGKFDPSTKAGVLAIKPLDLFSIEEAVDRLRVMLPSIPDWTVLMHFLPEKLNSTIKKRSAISTTLMAALDLVHKGKADIRQDGGAFSPIYIKVMNNDIK